MIAFNADDPMVCSISNPEFVIYSSVVSFYLPFIVTLLVYIRIYIFLRMRRKRITFGQASGKVQPGSTPPFVVRQLSCFYVFLFLLLMFPLSNTGPFEKDLEIVMYIFINS